MTKYAFKDEIVLVAGVPLSGFAEGDDVVQGSRNVEAFTHSVGADGKMLVTQNADRSGSFRFRLQRGSTSNAYLNALFANQERGHFIALPVGIVNTKSGDSVGGTKGYITKPADVSFGNGAGGQEWTLMVEDYEALFGALSSL